MMYNILGFGAKTKTDCTKSIQSAIDECAKNGGGCVVIPSGKYISGTIWLKDNVDLHFEKGAVLKASTNIDDYNKEDAYTQNFGCENEKWRAKHLIIALECENVSITGDGIIDGSGDSFFGEERVIYQGYAWEGGYVTAKDDENLRPGQLICFIECKDIKIKDIAINNTPCWSLFLHGCQYVQINGIKITNPFEFVNTDGIDIDCCRFVTLSDCIIITGDDAIAIRCDSILLKKSLPCEYVTISNCILASNSSVFRIGVGNGVIRHIRVSNITTSKGGNFVTFATAFTGHGSAEIDDVGFSNVSANNIGQVINCVVVKGLVKNVSMQNINVEAGGGICIVQREGGRVTNFFINDVNIKVTKKIMPENKYLVLVENAVNVIFDNVSVLCKDGMFEEIFHQSEGKVIIRNCIM